MLDGGPLQLPPPARCKPVLTHPLFQAKGDVALRTDVAHAGNSALEKVAELFDDAQRRVGFARSLLHIAFRQRIGQVRVQIDESRKNGFARNVRYFGVRGHADVAGKTILPRSEEHTSELQSLTNLVCRLLLEK